MQSRRGDPNSQSPKHGGRALAGRALSFDLASELRRLRERAEYQQGDPTGRTLVKEPDLRIVLMALKQGARMEEHETSGPVSIQTLDGRLQVEWPDGSLAMQPGQLLALEPAVRHQVQALEDAGFVLTLGRTRYQQLGPGPHEPGGDSSPEP